MMRYLQLICLVLVFASCQNEAPTDQKAKTPDVAAEQPAAPTKEDVGPEDRTYVPGVRFGMITATTTPEQLVEYYGAENVREDSISLGEGFFVDGYTLFPEQPGEVAIVYPDEEGYVKELQVTIDLEDTVWKSAQNGIGIGTTLEELERYNGQAFNFFGFDWDYGGVVTSWRPAGALKDHRIRLGYNFEKRGEIQLHPTLVGDQKVTSSSPYLQDLEVKVIQIIVRLPEVDR